MHDKETESLSKYTRFFGNRQWKSLFSAVFLTALSQERAKLSQNRQRFFYHKGFAQAHIIEYTFGVNDVQTHLSLTSHKRSVRQFTSYGPNANSQMRFPHTIYQKCTLQIVKKK